MALGVLCTKIGMTEIFTDEGVRVPVTVLYWGDNVVLQKKDQEKDGYTAVQVGYDAKRKKRTNKAAAGHFEKAGVDPLRHVQEFRVSAEQLEGFQVGQPVGTDIMNEVRSVDVRSTSKGKGFAGVMKRHNFAGFRATHGTHEYFRHGGSIGCRAKPGKVHKGKKMPGQMGNKMVTTQNVSVVEVDPDERTILLRGAVPGGKGAVVQLLPSSRTPKRGRGVTAAAQERSKNPMKASKAGK